LFRPIPGLSRRIRDGWQPYLKYTQKTICCSRSNVVQKIEDRPVVIEEIQQRLEEKVDQLKQNMDEPVVQAVQEALQGDKAEETEIDRRKANVIVHGVPESDAEDADQRIDNDMMVLATMFQEVKVENVTVDSVVRLGKKAADPTQSPRPMKVVLDSVESKVSLLKKAKKT